MSFVLCNSQLQLENGKNQLRKCILNVFNEIYQKNQSLYFVYDKDPDNILPYDFYNPKVVVHTKRSFIDKVFKALWLFYMLNTVVIVYTNTEDVPLIYTADPMTVENKCGNEQLHFVAHNCNSLNIRFAKPLRNYNGCPVVYGIPIDDKYTSIYYTSVLVDAILLELERLNITVKKRYYTNINKLHKDPHEIIVHKGFKDQNKLLEDSNSIGKSNWLWIVPLPRKISPIEIYWNIFKLEIWLLIVFSALLVLATWWIVQRWGSEQSKPLLTLALEVYSVILTGSVNCMPTKYSLRILIIFFIVFTIHIQTAYVSLLIDFMTVQKYEKSIENIHELADSNLKLFVAKQTYMKYFKKSPPRFPLFKKIKKKVIVSELPEQLNLQYIMDANNCSTVVPEGLVRAIEIRSKHRIPNPMFVDNTLIGEFEEVFTMIEGHFFIDTLNAIMMVTTENGLREFLTTQYNNVVQAELSKITEVKPEAIILSFDHIYGVLVLLGAGLCVSLIVFFFEILCHNHFNN
ncbi:hypothetical protein FQA39_LY07714 [Lamprigera yunnana]|nr:hypothetical protein FQA39_LY07714 [Lamprigera yunnana]